MDETVFPSDLETEVLDCSGETLKPYRPVVDFTGRVQVFDSDTWYIFSEGEQI